MSGKSKKGFSSKTKDYLRTVSYNSIDSISAKNTTAIFQALAIKRFDIIHSLENEIF